MTKRTNLVIGAALVVTAGAWTACKSSSTNDDSAPPGTTPVTAPYAVCTPLDPGTFATTSDMSYAVPATTSCNPAGGPVSGPADMHCVGVTQTVNGADCNSMNPDAGAQPTGTPPDAGPPGLCDENGTDGAYGTTHDGTDAYDDDCKYHVTYTVSPVCENNGTYFVVTANYLTRDGAPLTGASTFAETCLNDTHPGPNADQRPPVGNQQVVEGPPGTYTVGPIVFDAPGNWTVRFHFNEFCCDIASDSPHGHAAFLVNVP